MNGKRKSGDYAGISILLGNAITIGLALYQGWSLGPLLLIYWAQSVVIGVFSFFRMLKLRQFCTEGFTSGGQKVPETEAGKTKTAFFFAAHYGFFHVAYAVFVAGVAFGKTEDGQHLIPAGEWWWILVGVIGFVISHAYSFYKNVGEDVKRRPNLGVMMFLPYLRIVPMHLTIIAGGAFAKGSGAVVLLFFLLLKTGADYGFHIVEHRILQRSKPETGTDNSGR